MFFSLLSALGYGIGIVSGLVGIYWFIKSLKNPKARQLGYVFGAIAIIICTITYLVANQPSAPGVRGLGTTPTPNIGNSTQTTATTPTPTDTPTPSPTPCPTPCTVYQENGSDNWQGWAVSSPWKIVSSEGKNLLINQGGGQNTTPSAISPFNLSGVQNFAIEAKILVPQHWAAQSGFFRASIRLIGCLSTEKGTWYEGGMYYDANSNSSNAGVSYGQSNINSFDPGQTWHTYRLEVRGNSLTLKIDNAVIAQGTDNTFQTCGTQFGLANEQIIVQVSSFAIITL